MAQIVITKPLTLAVSGVAKTFLPGKVIRDVDFTAADYANIVAAAAALGNASKDFSSPDPGLAAAQAAAITTRLEGGDSENQTQTLMQDGAALDASSQVSTGTTTLVAGSSIVAVPAQPDGSPGVPVGSKVYGTITTKAGKTSQLFANATDTGHIQLSSNLSPTYDALLESAGGAATLVAGTVDIALANAVGDRLGVAVVTPHGTPGVLSVKRKDNATVTVESWQEPVAAAGTLVAGTVDIALANNVGDDLSVDLVGAAIGTAGVLSVKRKDGTTVTVQSWLAGTGIQVLDASNVKAINHGPAANPDISDVKAYNFGQSANDTSLCRWSVVRP